MKYIHYTIIAFTLILYGMLGHSIISGEISPSENHLEKAREVNPGKRLIQVGFSSGSYSCVNSECDYSNVIDQKQYVDFPSFSSLTTVTKDYQGAWSTDIESVTLSVKLTILGLYVAFGIGACFSIRNLKFV